MCGRPTRSNAFLHIPPPPARARRCLRLWLQQQQACPTCRATIPVNNAAAASAAAAAADRAAAAPPNPPAGEVGGAPVAAPGIGEATPAAGAMSDTGGGDAAGVGPGAGLLAGGGGMGLPYEAEGMPSWTGNSTTGLGGFGIGDGGFGGLLGLSGGLASGVSGDDAIPAGMAIHAVVVVSFICRIVCIFLFPGCVGYTPRHSEGKGDLFRSSGTRSWRGINNCVRFSSRRKYRK